MADKEPDWGEPWRQRWQDRHALEDRDGARVLGVAGDKLLYHEDVHIASRLAVLANAFAGVPVTRLADPTAAVPQMFLAWCKGDDDAAAVAADWLLDRRQAEAVPGFAGRDTLLSLLASCRDFLRRVAFTPTGPPSRIKLLAELDAVLGK